MKKNRFYSGICLWMCIALVFASCGRQTAGEMPTEVPAITGNPELSIETPEASVTREPNETPTVTEPLKATDEPNPTESLAATMTPKPTEPIDATATPKPIATLKPTVTPVPTKVPAKITEYTYTYADMETITQYGCSVEMTAEEVLEIQYEDQYGEIKMYLPDGMDMKYCKKVTVKAKSETGNLSVKLFDHNIMEDVWCNEAFVRWDCKGEGVREYEIFPRLNSVIYGLGFMALDQVEDFSEYDVTVYSVTFHMEDGFVAKNRPTPTPVPTATPAPIKKQTMWGDVTYRFDELEAISFSDDIYKVNKDGSLELTFNKEWQEARFVLPEAIDLRYCYSITVEGEAAPDFAFKMFGKEHLNERWNGELFVKYACTEEGKFKYSVIPEKIADVYGIGFTSGQITPSGKSTKIHSVTFHMASDEKFEIPRDIAPDVTENMTFLNTYGTVFENFGCAVCIQDLRLPITLKKIKEQYSSITLGNDFKPDFLFHDSKMISVEEANQLGYIIPESYKESKVPTLFFDDVDEGMKICAENGLRLRAHTLIWQAQTPTWFFRTGYKESGSFVSPEVMDARLEFYIRNVVEHVCNYEYGDVVYAWDVVNEYPHADRNNSDWHKVYGEPGTRPEYIKMAFEIVDEILKKHGIRDRVSLIFNDFNTFVPETTDFIISTVNFINSDGPVCDGVGMQAHMDIYWPEDGVFKRAAQRFLDAGFEVQITELDITIKNPREGSEDDQTEVFGKVFEDLLDLKLKGADIPSVTIWGMSDNVSWLQTVPLLFETQDKPKDAYYKVLQTYLDRK